MAQNTNITIPADVWTEITDGDVAAITFQNQSGNFTLIKGTSGAAPTDRLGAIRYNPGQGERNVAVSDLWPGEAVTRLWALAPDGATIMVSNG